MTLSVTCTLQDITAGSQVAPAENKVEVIGPAISVTLSQLDSYKPSRGKLPPEQDIATHMLSPHFGVVESVQSSDEIHVLTTFCVTAVLLLRIVDLFVGDVDVLDVSVSEIVAFPPNEHLAF